MKAKGQTDDAHPSSRLFCFPERFRDGVRRFGAWFCSSCSQPIVEAKDWFVEKVADGFEQYGYFVHDHAWKFIVIPTVLCAFLSLGMLNRQPQLDMERLYSPPVSASSDAKRALDAVFPIERLSYIFAVSEDGSGLLSSTRLRNLDIFWHRVLGLKVPYDLAAKAVTPGDNSIGEWLVRNMNDYLTFGDEVFLDRDEGTPTAPPAKNSTELLGDELPLPPDGSPTGIEGSLPEGDSRSNERQLMRSQVVFSSGASDPGPLTAKGRGPDYTRFVTLKDVCVADPFGGCKSASVLDLYTTSALWGAPLRVRGYPTYINYKTEMVYRIDALMGNITKRQLSDSTAVVYNATAFAFRVDLNGATELRALSAAWEQGLITLINKLKVPGITFYIRTERSVNDELSISSTLQAMDFLRLAVAVIFVACFTVVINTSFDRYRSKHVPAFIGVLSTGLAYGGGVGLCHMMGIRHVPPAEGTPFLVLGIGVDDIFVLINAYSLTYLHSTDARKRIGLTLRDAGISITITTATNILAFAIGAASVYYSIYVFCILTAAGLLAGYALCLTMFLGVLALDAQSEMENRSISVFKFKEPSSLLPDGSYDSSEFVDDSRKVKEMGWKSPPRDEFQDGPPSPESAKRSLALSERRSVDGGRETLPLGSAGTASPRTPDKDSAAITTSTGNSSPSCSETSAAFPLDGERGRVSPVSYDQVSSLEMCSMTARNGNAVIHNSDSEGGATSRARGAYTTPMLGSRRSDCQTSSGEARRVFFKGVSGVQSSPGAAERGGADYSSACIPNGEYFVEDLDNHVVVAERVRRVMLEKKIQWAVRRQSRKILMRRMRHKAKRSIGRGGEAAKVLAALPPGFSGDDRVTDEGSVGVIDDDSNPSNNSRPPTPAAANSPLHHSIPVTPLNVVFGSATPSGSPSGFGIPRPSPRARNTATTPSGPFASPADPSASPPVPRPKVSPFSEDDEESNRADDPTNPWNSDIGAKALSPILDSTSSHRHMASSTRSDGSRRHSQSQVELTSSDIRSQTSFSPALNLSSPPVSFAPKSATSEGIVQQPSSRQGNSVSSRRPSQQRPHNSDLPSVQLPNTAGPPPHPISKGTRLPLIHPDDYTDDDDEDDEENGDDEVEDNSIVEDTTTLSSSDSISGPQHLVRVSDTRLVPYDNIKFEEPPGTVGCLARDFFMNHYGPFITKPWVKVVILVSFLSTLIFCGYNSTNVRAGLSLRDVTPYRSYLRDFYDIRERYFDSYGDECVVFFPEETPWWDKDVQNALLKLSDAIETADFTVIVINGLQVFLKDNQKNLVKGTKEEFAAELEKWFTTPRGKLFSTSFRYEEGKIVTWKFYYWMRYNDNSRLSMDWVQRVQAMLKHHDEAGYFKGHIYTPLAVMWEADPVIFSATLSNMAVALLTMALIASLLIPDLRSGMMVLMVIVMIDVNVCGVMPLWSLNLNMLTMVNLVISIGFAVDYTAHITHCFSHCKGESRNHRVVETLVLMGLPVTNGMISTYAAVAVLATSDKYVLIVTFQMMTSVLIFSFVHGVVLMPVVLSLVGPFRPRSYDRIKIENGREVGGRGIVEISEPFVVGSTLSAMPVMTTSRLPSKERGGKLLSAENMKLENADGQVSMSEMTPRRVAAAASAVGHP